MIDEENARLLGELHGKLDTFVDHYHKDREATTQRYEAEEKRRDDFRIEIKKDVSDLRDEIKPVVRDHRIIVGIGKWFGGAAAGLFGILKVWDAFRDHFK